MASGLFELVENRTLTKEHLVGVDVFQTDEKGFTMLHRAAGRYTNIDASKLLLETKWIPDKCVYHKWTALHWAFINLNFDIAKLLLSTKRKGDLAYYYSGKMPKRMIYFHNKKERTIQSIFPLTLLSI